MNRIHRSTVLCILALTVLAALPALAADGVVNVNEAGLDELMLLPRVGETVAQRIITFRQENGSFKTAEDLLLVKGIGDRTFERMAPYVAVDGETTLSEKVAAPRPAEADEE